MIAFSVDGARGWFRIRPILLVIAAILVSGCGQKSFPVVPDQPPPPPVSNLLHVIENNRVKLSWMTPPCTDCTSVVHRFRQPLTEPLCETCPIPFTRITDIPAELAGGGERTFHVEPIEKGYRYIFKVNIHSGSGTGPDSNLVKFEY